jgi:uncharacterized protein (DUF1697 family)
MLAGNGGKGGRVTSYVALLRGINVGGYKKIGMKDLQALVAGLGHSEVSTYIQSGNVIFRSAESDPAEVARGIEAAVTRDLGMEVRVMVRSREELARMTESNPFLAAGANPANLHMTFLAEAPAPATLDTLTVPEAGTDEFRILGREVYLHFPAGYGNTKLSNAFWERKLCVAGTTRNWNTITKLLQLAER